MSRNLDMTELEWSAGQPDASPPSSSGNPDASRSGGWGSTEVVLVEGAVVALLVIAYLVYVNGGSDAGEVADGAQDGQYSGNARGAYSTESEP